MCITSQLIHLIFNSNLDREWHMENLEKLMLKFLKTSLTSMEAGVHEARLRGLMQFMTELQVGNALKYSHPGSTNKNHTIHYRELWALL